MTLDKAVETLQDILRFVKPGDPPDEHDAIKLGVEALEGIKAQRACFPGEEMPLLPGESHG